MFLCLIRWGQPWSICRLPRQAASVRSCCQDKTLAGHRTVLGAQGESSTMFYEREGGLTPRRVALRAGLNKTAYVPGNMLRFQLIFRLTSSVDDNYLHIHTLKGIVQASTVSSPAEHSHCSSSSTCCSMTAKVPVTACAVRLGSESVAVPATRVASKGRVSPAGGLDAVHALHPELHGAALRRVLPGECLPPAALASLRCISRRLDRAYLTHAGTGRMPTVSGRA